MKFQEVFVFLEYVYAYSESFWDIWKGKKEMAGRKYAKNDRVINASSLQSAHWECRGL